MRVAVSGSHGAGKSTLVAAFVERLPDYGHEPEAYELLADEVPLTDGEGPTIEGLEALMRHTVSVLAGYPPGSRVVIERSPVDYLAYAAASGDAWTASAASDFLEEHLPAVRASLHHLDLIAFLPLPATGPLAAGTGQEQRHRRRVDEELRRALLDDDYDLFADEAAPIVVELPPLPARRLAALLDAVGADGYSRSR